MVKYNDIYDDNDDNVAGNKGNKGKFSDRLKKMRRDRLKKKKNISLDEEEPVVKSVGRNVLKVFLALPSIVYSHVMPHNGRVDSAKKIVESRDSEFSLTEESNINDRRIRINKIRCIDVSLLKKKRELYVKSFGRYLDPETIDAERRIAVLQKEILDLIKKKLVKNVNDLEILQSELYVLRELSSEDVYFSECQHDIKEIKKLLSKIKALKEKYDYLKDNVDFEYMLEYGDDVLVDKILELKDLCSRDDIKYIVDNYKLLDEFKYLYLKIDKLEEDSIRFEEYKNKKAAELKERDIDFDKLKNDVYNVDRENARYDRFVREQEMFLNDLDSKISQIDSYERITYKLKGFNQLLGNSFKYLGLLLVNPLKGLIPGIATQTLVTKNLVHNLYNNLEWQENRRMYYDAIDYSNSIRIAINNLDDTSSLVDSTLEDIMRLKTKYEQEFSKYQNSFPGYRDAIRKINKIQNAVLGSKMKIERMRTKMKEKERQNNSKMKRVKKLNSSANS